LLKNKITPTNEIRGNELLAIKKKKGVRNRPQKGYGKLSSFNILLISIIKN